MSANGRVYGICSEGHVLFSMLAVHYFMPCVTVHHFIPGHIGVTSDGWVGLGHLGN